MPSRASSFQKNAEVTTRVRELRERAERADEHPVERGIRLVLLGDLVDGLEHRDRVGEHPYSSRSARFASRVSAWVTTSSSRPVAQQRDLAGRLEPGAEAARGLADALGDGADLAVALGEEGDDPVGLAELDGAQHHPLVAVQPRHHRV